MIVANSKPTCSKQVVLCNKLFAACSKKLVIFKLTEPLSVGVVQLTSELRLVSSLGLASSHSKPRCGHLAALSGLDCLAASWSYNHPLTHYYWSTM